MPTDTLTTTALRGHFDKTPEALLAATSRIVCDSHRRERLARERRTEPRWTVHQAVRVTPLRPDGSGYDPAGEPVTAFIRDISTHGVGLLHAHAFATSRVLVTFQLIDGDTISIAMDIKWCCSLGDFGCASGGIAVGVLGLDASREG